MILQHSSHANVFMRVFFVFFFFFFKSHLLMVVIEICTIIVGIQQDSKAQFNFKY